MSAKKKVSIIVPVYNAEKIIKQCLMHIQSQTYPLIEIVCVNDGSTDGSRELLECLAKQDSRIVVVNKLNGGVSSARNKGIEIATGYYIQFVDSDDLIDENMVELLVNAIEENDSQLAICGYRFSNGQPERIPASGTWDKEKFLKEFYSFYTGGFVCSPWNKLFVKNYITDLFPEDMNLGEDAVFNMHYILNISKICTLGVAPYFYEVGNTSSLSWRYNEKALYCEEKKNQYIMQCLKSSNVMEYNMKIVEEFSKDFKRCIDSEILSGKYGKKDLEMRIYDNALNPFWKEVLVQCGYMNGIDEIELMKTIKQYVVKKIAVRYINAFKAMLKKTIKGIILCREQSKA